MHLAPHIFFEDFFKEAGLLISQIFISPDFKILVDGFMDANPEVLTFSLHFQDWIFHGLMKQSFCV